MPLVILSLAKNGAGSQNTASNPSQSPATASTSWRTAGFAAGRLSPEFGGGAIVRKGNAVACTIDEPIPGFRGLRKRWWSRDIEKPFPNWKDR